MKKLILTLGIALAVTTISNAQILPKVQVGIKGGVNLSSLSNSGSTFSSENRAGYLGGLWARFGALGFNFQPELYITSKNVDINNSNGPARNAKFTSIDVPLLLGGKIGAFGLGGRFYAGPLLSFAINKDNNFGSAVGSAARFDYKSSNFAITAGAGIDIRKISIDLRYEAGLTKQNYFDGSTNYKTRVSLFNLSLGYAFL
ncbi:PorT family protein [Mucilaginibacter sp. 14171R-50]|uniref:porin family protein n=1 Tax=Mucilaginibacter sp. 14171R-50 TaxID=2703789 RepID=UPI00138B8F11|nr:porin family protein [Mucilaginibacter sp. 14171R-50]QHS57273.1 PorT family protein [Mucilaginibacter sp. 14171R-50]